jgi:hypothetical protein
MVARSVPVGEEIFYHQREMLYHHGVYGKCMRNYAPGWMVALRVHKLVAFLMIGCKVQC